MYHVITTLRPVCRWFIVCGAVAIEFQTIQSHAHVLQEKLKFIKQEINKWAENISKGRMSILRD